MALLLNFVSPAIFTLENAGTYKAGHPVCSGNEAIVRAQERWLTRDLAAVNRTRTPWVLVNFHNPWYTTDYSFKVQSFPSLLPAVGLVSLGAVLTERAAHVGRSLSRCGWRWSPSRRALAWTSSSTVRGCRLHDVLA